MVDVDDVSWFDDCMVDVVVVDVGFVGIGIVVEFLLVIGLL